MNASDEPLKLHVGCGRTILPGWINLDISPLPGVDLVADLDNCRNQPLTLEDNSIGEFLLSHVLEHIRDAMGLMTELYRVARPQAKMTLRLPYGTSDDAWEDPTHVRPYFINSCLYFSQPAYWRADYGYTADWEVQSVTLHVASQRHQGKSAQQIMAEVMSLRNVVQEMVVEMVAIKPARPPQKELMTAPTVNITLV